MLKLNSIDLSNYRGFRKLHLDFTSNVTCIAGINGSGKSSILSALALCFSWIISRAKSQNGKGWVINKQFDIYTESKRNQNIFGEFESFVQKFAREGFIEGSFSFYEKDIIIRQSFASLGNKAESESDYSSLSTIFNYVNEHVQTASKSFSLPVLVYYPTNRNVIDIPVRIRLQHSFNQFSTYDNALDSATRFRDFFEWYRDREDIENAKKNELRDFDYVDPLLSAVRNAIYKCMPEYKNLYIQRNPQLMLMSKHDVELAVNTLSDGEKCLLSLVGDLARRLALASPENTNPLQGNGIVLIDEVDLHLHPSWQRKIIAKLKETFPNCQFIVTTHSPQVLGELQSSDIYILNNGNVYKPEQTFGLTSNDILNLMDYDENDISMIRNQKISIQLSKLAELVDKENYDEAKKLISEIENLTNGPINETRMYQTEIDMLAGEY